MDEIRIDFTHCKNCGTPIDNEVASRFGPFCCSDCARRDREAEEEMARGLVEMMGFDPDGDFPEREG